MRAIVRDTYGSPNVLELPHQALGFRVQAYGVTQAQPHCTPYLCVDTSLTDTLVPTCLAKSLAQNVALLANLSQKNNQTHTCCKTCNKY